MSWSSTAPDGTKSVKDNRPILADNTTYIETTMKKDHHWNEGIPLSGHHNVIQQSNHTTNLPRPIAPLNGELYVRTVSLAAGNENSSQLFYLQEFSGYPLAYQVTPAYLTGSTALTGTFATVVTVPKNVYGTIYIWRNNTRNIQTATFFSDNTVVEGFSNRIKLKGSGADSSVLVEFRNYFDGSADQGLQLQAIVSADSNGTYNWKIFYYGTVDLPVPP